MSNKIVLRPMGSSNHRREPLLQKSKSSPKAGTRLGEAVGGTAAVCCCAPCSLANIVYLAIYKVPVSLYLRALNKKKQRRRRRIQASGEGMFPAKRRCTCGCCEDVVGVRVHPRCSDDEKYGGVKSECLGVQEKDKDVLELEKEMWDTFYGTGFWRSSSQKNKDSLSFSSSQTATPDFQVIIVPTL